MHISSVLPWVEQYGATNLPGPSRLVCICCTSANLTVYHMQAGKSPEGATGTWYRKGPTTATDGLESSRTHVTSRTKPPSLGIFGIIVKQCQTLLTWHSIDSMLCFRRKVLTRRLDVTIQAHTHTTSEMKTATQWAATNSIKSMFFVEAFLWSPKADSYMEQISQVGIIRTDHQNTSQSCLHVGCVVVSILDGLEAIAAVMDWRDHLSSASIGCGRNVCLRIAQILLISLDAFLRWLLMN